MTDELQNIISGKSPVRYGANIQAAISYLEASKATSALDKTDKHFKRKETERLKQYIDEQNLLIKDIDLNDENVLTSKIHFVLLSACITLIENLR